MIDDSEDESNRRTARVVMRLVGISVPVAAVVLLLRRGQPPAIVERRRSQLPASAARTRGAGAAGRRRSDRARACLLTAGVDGQPLVDAHLEAGGRQSFDAQTELTLTVSDPSAIELTINGLRGRSLGAEGVMTTVRLTPDNYKNFVAESVSAPTPLLDFFKRGEVAREVRLLAAAGALAPRAHEQLSILILLLDDTRSRDSRSTAQATLDRIPVESLTTFLARSDVPIGVREFFADRGVFPAEIPALSGDDPLLDTEPADMAAPEEESDDQSRDSLIQQLASMGFTDRLKAAMKGTS